MCERKYTEKRYYSWNEFKANIAKDICSQDYLPYGEYIFRGQASENWGLTSGFDRQFGNLDHSTRSKLQRNMIDNFKSNCIRWMGMTELDNYEETSVEALGQHYGLPTRLLDWSYGLYTAAFFAYAETYIDELEIPPQNVAIWILWKNHEIWQGDMGVKIRTDYIPENQRQRNQFGLFTVNNSPETSIEEYVNTCAKRTNVDGALYKVCLPRNERKNVDGPSVNVF